jgi:FKBP-type peptidyl-prolyl cis-trans isomerase FkpA
MKTRITIVFVTVFLAAACGGGDTSSNSGTANSGSNAAPAPPAAFSQVDLATGTGAQAGKGAKVTVKYTGWIYDSSKPDNKGTKFDTSDDHGPITFTLGVGEVIPGWDQGFNGMRVGGKRRLVIPPQLGYGEAGTPGGPIPPNAGLVFEMELVDVK